MGYQKIISTHCETSSMFIHLYIQVISMSLLSIGGPFLFEYHKQLT